jgi:hypothetical protein
LDQGRIFFPLGSYDFACNGTVYQVIFSEQEMNEKVAPLRALVLCIWAIMRECFIAVICVRSNLHVMSIHAQLMTKLTSRQLLYYKKSIHT